MSSLMQSYEHQYSILTADLTAKIGRLKSCTDDERTQLSRDIQVNFEEANDLLEQLELESRTLGSGSRVPAYRAELQRVKEDYRSVLNSHSNHYTIENEEFDDWGGPSEQHRKLLDNTERLERGSKVLAEGYRIAVETEQIGAQVLQDLNLQRETITRARDRLQETDENLNRSSRLVNTILMRLVQDRFILIAVFIAGIVICGGLYYFIR